MDDLTSRARPGAKNWVKKKEQANHVTLDPGPVLCRSFPWGLIPDRNKSEELDEIHRKVLKLPLKVKVQTGTSLRWRSRRTMQSVLLRLVSANQWRRRLLDYTWNTTWFALLVMLFVGGASGRNNHATEMSPRVVSTQYGKLRGILYKLDDAKLPQVEAFLGIRYASILGGDLRFMPPTSPMDKWTGIKVALKMPPVCPQRLPDIEELRRRMPHGRAQHFANIRRFLEEQSEECLNLNIYVPAQANASVLLPVVVLIQTETYEIGTGNAYDGSVLAGYGRVVVVTLNFRLGVLGFLTTGDSNAQGNYALLDQVAALHWLKENIAPFGGDPNQVTLMGQGYGAAMVNLLLVSPVTAGKSLFKRAILQSGSALSTWALSGDPLRLKQELADHVNCSEYVDNSFLLLKCLKEKPYQDLISVQATTPKYFSTFGPVIDKRSVLPADVKTLLQRNRSVFNDVDILLGVMKSEGLLLFKEEDITEGITEFQKVQMLRTYMRNVYSYHRQKLYDVVWHEYSDYDSLESEESLRDEMIELLGDAQYAAPIVDLANHHRSNRHGAFLYTFSYPSRLDSYPQWAGGVHGDDLIYVLGAPLSGTVEPFPSTYTQSEQMLSEAVMTYWTNFIKSGNPNLPLDQEATLVDKRNRFSGITWPKYNSQTQEYLNIGMRPVVRNHYKGSKMALWLDLVPKFHKSDDLDNKYHLLCDYNNQSTFEAHGTKPLNYHQLVIPPPTSPPPPPTTTVITTTTFTPSPTTLYNIPKSTPKPRRKKPDRSTRPTIPPKPQPTQKQLDPAESSLNDKTTISITVIVAVGGGIVVLNLLICGAIYYQRDKMRQERKAREIEMNKEQSMRMIDSSGTIGQLDCDHHHHHHHMLPKGPDSDTDGASSMTTPPASHNTVPRTLPPPVQTQVTSLPPMHSSSTRSTAPIPVSPPQPPYYSTLPAANCGNHTGHLGNHTNNNHQGSNGPRTLSRPRPDQPGYHQPSSQHHATHRHILCRSSSVDSGTENHSGNPSTVV